MLDILKKFNSKEWISFDETALYEQILSTLNNIKSSLPEWNILRDKIDILTKNFLTPKEAWVHIIKNILSKIVDFQKWTEVKVSKEDVVTSWVVLKWAITSMIDLAQNSSEWDIQTLIWEFNNIPQIKDLIKTIPDFHKIINILLQSLKTLDKNTVSRAIDDFIWKNIDNILLLANSPSDKVPDNAKFWIINSWVEFIRNILNENSIEVWMNWVSSLSFVQNNPILKQSFDVLNSWKLTPNDKHRLFQAVTSLMDISTKPDLWENFEEKISKSLNDIINLLWEFNKDWKIDEEKTIDLIKQIFWITKEQEQSFLDKISKTEWFMAKAWVFWESVSSLSSSVSWFFSRVSSVQNVSELWNIFVDNSDLVGSFIKWSLNWEWWFEASIRNFVSEKKLAENIKLASWDLLWRVWQAIKLNTTEMILKMRKWVSSVDVWSSLNISEKETNPNQNDAWKNISDLLFDNAFESVKKLIFEKISAWWNLTRENIISTVLSNIWNMFQNEETRNKFFENAKTLWLNLDWQEQKVLWDFLSFVSKNPKFEAIINSLLSWLLNRVSNSNNILSEIWKIKSEINSLFLDFVSSYKKWWINWALETFNSKFSPETKDVIIWNVISWIKEYLWDKQRFQELLNIPGIKEKLPSWVWQEQLSKIFDSIPWDVIFDIIKWELPNLKIEKLKDPSYLLSLVNKILWDKRVDFQTILKTALDSKIKIDSWNDSSKIEVSQDLLKWWVDSLYLLMQRWTPEQVKELVWTLWLNKVFWDLAYSILPKIGKNDLKEVLWNNVLFVNQAISWKIDINSWLKFVSEIYEKFPAWNRLEVVESIIDSWVLSNWWEKSSWNKFELTKQNISHISNILFNSLEWWNLDRVVKKLIPAEFRWFLDTQFLWNWVVENWKILLQSIWKEKFSVILERNIDAINKLSVSEWPEKTRILAKLWKEFFAWVDTNTLKEKIPTNISKNERFLVDLLPSIQTSLEKVWSNKIWEIAVIWEKINNFINDNPKKSLESYWLTQSNIDSFSSNIFDIFNSIFKDFMSKNQLTREQISQKFELPNSDSESDVSLDVWWFVMNNLWFATYWWISSIFNWKDYAMKNWALDLFLDDSKKSSFVSFVRNSLEKNSSK